MSVYVKTRETNALSFVCFAIDLRIRSTIMDSFELLSIPRYMGSEAEVSASPARTDPNRSDLFSKLISESKARKKLRLNSETI